MAAEDPPSYSQTERDLDSSSSRDSRRGLEWLYVEAEGAYAYTGLRTFNIDEKNFSAGFIETVSSGPTIGAGVGLRLLFLTIGARGRIGFFNTWDIFSVGGEIGLHIPLGNLEPHFDVGGGYVALGSFKSAVESGAVKDALAQTQIQGFYARLNGGLDYYVTPTFSIGATAGLELLGLTRPGLDPSQIANIKNAKDITDAQKAQADLLALEGTSYGGAITGGAVLGLHF